jgi:PAS domain S-box-containing protein
LSSHPESALSQGNADVVDTRRDRSARRFRISHGACASEATEFGFVVIELSKYDFEILRTDNEFNLYRGHRANESSSCARASDFAKASSDKSQDKSSMGREEVGSSFEASAKEELSSILVLTPVLAQPDPETIKRLEHESSFLGELDSECAVRPIALTRHGDRTVLVLEDPGGEPLDRFLGQPMEPGRFLRLAISLAAGLSKLHGKGLLHKDVKPAHILVDSVTCKVWFTGFGISSRLARERPSAEPPEVIAGTLAYMAPEQTGRMNRSIDSRSDLYSLGVTFYQMLTGFLPFTASDPMEWVHCHLARQPEPPSERVEGVPRAVSAVVMKLLAKTAEERYQTAAGLEADLRRCLDEYLKSSGVTGVREKIPEFLLGQHDTPDQLVIPEKLYGRERELGVLHAAFDRVVAGSGPELVLITGQAGLGKSAIAHELHRALAQRLGLFSSGKFDQYKRDIPYASLAQALLNLIRPFLAKSETELAPLCAELTAALGLNGALMVTLLPDLEHIIGPQPPVAELPARDAQRRFQMVFRRLLGVFARPEHPLALFLDDLQWLDAATLDLLEDLLIQPDLQHLLVIGAYRDDEVTPTHPLMQRLTAIRQAGGRVHAIELKPLKLEEINRIVAGALHCDSARPLARLVHQKTAGNPFFAIQFLIALAEEGLLSFDRETGRWTWDLRRIRAKGYTDNVADLLLDKLRRLPATTRALLKQLACLGNSAPVATLATVQSRNEDAVHATLRAAVRVGLLFRQEGAYRFLHDRVREAAYALIPDGERAAVHLTIGRRLAARTPPAAIEESIFEIAGQLNSGAALIRSWKERERLAELNLIAGRRAKASTAYTSALTYLTAGAVLLPEDAWERRHDLAFALGLQRAECEFLTGGLVEAETRLAELASHAVTPSELATLTRLRIDLFMTLGGSDRAVAAGLDCLHHFGIGWSAHPTKQEVEHEFALLLRQLGDRPIESLFDLPRMVDPVACATMDVLASLVTPALWTDHNLRRLLIGRMGTISLEHGNSEVSGYAYTAVGNVLGLYFGDYDAGFRFGELGLGLVEQPGMDRWKARVYLAFGNLGKPSVRQARTGRPLAWYAFEAAQRVGDLTYAGISRNNLVTQLLASGAPLAEVHQEAKAGLEFARRACFGTVVSLITAQLGLIRTLRGLTPVFGRFNDENFQEEQFEQQLAAETNLGTTPLVYWIRKLQARILANDPVAAVAAANNAEPLLWMTPVIFERSDYHFYAALALAGLCESVPDAESAQYQEPLAAHHLQLQAWAEHCPENFVSRASLLSAEIAHLEGRELEAEHLYEQAIRSARHHGLTHDEAIAYERASSFYRVRGFDEIATVYLRNARHCYLRWGAEGKVWHLDEMYPDLKIEGAATGLAGKIEARIDQLDLATVVKVSQAVSSEIQFEKLIQTLLKEAIEQAGAQRGLLILPESGQYQIEAEIKTDLDQVQVQLRHAPITSSELPESLFRYVIRTQQKIILDDASVDNVFSEDEYLRRRHPRSILCLPLVKQTKTVGVLYLENNLAPRVFTQRRLAMLELLASQAAISLDHARLYSQLSRANANLEHEVNERLRAEAVARRSEAYLAEAESLSKCGSWALKPATKEITYWSQKRYHLFGFDPDAGMPSYEAVLQRIHPEDRARWLRNTEAAERRDSELDFRVVLPGGEVRYIHGVGHPVFSESGELVEIVGAAIDITELKRAEEQQREAQAHLAHVTRVATLGELAGSIAHEVNQPLTAIINNADACLALLPTEISKLDDVREALSDIISDADRASAVLARIRGLIKKSPPQKSRLDLNEAIDGVIVLARGQLDRNEVSLRTKLANDLPLIKGDRVQLQQVILNLVINAIEAMSGVSDGPRELSISSEEVIGTPGPAAVGEQSRLAGAAGLEAELPTSNAKPKTQNASVLVSVADSGPGLDPSKADHLFDAFYTTKPQGLGMGLSISRSIIEAHGGRLWAKANVPKGALFQFTLPIALSGEQ